MPDTTTQFTVPAVAAAVAAAIGDRDLVIQGDRRLRTDGGETKLSP